jgi:cell division protein FtsB
MRRAVRALIVAVVVGGILFLFVLPGRTWLSQGRSMSQAQHRVSVLAQENRDLRNRIKELQNPANIEQIARSQYGLVPPGWTAYGIVLPAATTTTTTVPVAPPTTAHHR